MPLDKRIPAHMQTTRGALQWIIYWVISVL